MTDHVIIEKLQLCRDIRVMLQPLWYWPVLSALNTAEENKVTLEELRPFICGLNTVYLQHNESNQEQHVQHSREYLDQIDRCNGNLYYKTSMYRYNITLHVYLNFYFAETLQF